ncbi:hypothetical protein SEA_NEOS5_13 [Mycobacterium phage Neos5]|uniref:DUF7196 domain-containing protein n=7 Tax=Pipefishvirus TaxID=1982899 RepID=V5RAF8_9CAUD|nr:hypothetical protein PHAEDRUS_12 [Mycobacterium phage Phaedrus]YP_002564111.1 gp13 [Mycobacterium phage Phlyer]YP_008858939.1 hypothetical protein X818_gp013 [Mycobacterium phage Bernardo]YP_009011245.1 hypothetical protein CM02_gp014 [Mycobacterium phage Gadjet]YP_009018523.1 hypothetical protein CM10_gp013 [Mycobacterium phage Akoma]YP_009604400.1 hypothetical protein FDH90_gp014 [Mycobacterium phage Athena]YP_655290.1 gp13 [Mycobacterium phage Pipefish]AER50144.1 hypothetical protein K
MGCNCNSGRKRREALAAGNPILGYRVILPDGTITPPEDKPPLFSQIEARAVVRQAGGGTTREIRQNPV